MIRRRSLSVVEDRAAWRTLIELALDHAREPTATTARRLGAAGRKAHRAAIPKPHTRERLQAFHALSYAAKEELPVDIAPLARAVEALMDGAPVSRVSPYYLES